MVAVAPANVASNYSPPSVANSRDLRQSSVAANDSPGFKKQTTAPATLLGQRQAFFQKLKDLKPVELAGDVLTPLQIVQIARHGVQVTLSEEAIQRIRLGFRIILKAVADHKKVYGLNTGVGERKTKPVFGQESETQSLDEELLASLSDELKDLWHEFGLPDDMLLRSIEFNSENIDAHTFATGDPFSREIVRGGMAILLNKMARGELGVYAPVANCLLECLNKDITPLVPKTASVGHADLGLMAAVGQTLQGKGWVIPKDQKGGEATPDHILEEAGLDPDSPTCPRRIVEAQVALKEAGIEPVVLVGKDFLSTISTNSMTAGSTAIGVHDARNFLYASVVVSSLCLQAMNGNIDTLLAGSPHDDANKVADAMLETLEGSSLWEDDPERQLQNVSSYRVAPDRLGAVLKRIDSLEGELTKTINHCDTNPRVVLDPDRDARRVLPKHIVELDGERHAIIPTARFEFAVIDQEVKGLLDSAMDLSTQMTNTVARLENEKFTGLPENLIPPGSKGAGLAYTEVGAGATNDAVHESARPAYSTNTCLAGQVEDLGNAAPLNSEKLHKTLVHLYSLLGFELFFGTHAISLRKELGKKLTLSPPVQEIYQAWRGKVPYSKTDREASTALGKAAKFLKAWC